MITIQKCQCGHASCKYYWLDGIGSFDQGSGFSKEEAEQIANLLNNNQLSQLAKQIHDQNVKVGWWDECEGYGGKIPDKYFIPTKIALMHSELSEALEGQRKSLMDDHLPQYPMQDVEYADTIIRILDVCGYNNCDIGQIILDKIAYNATREDHKRENRAKAGGKAV